MKVLNVLKIRTALIPILVFCIQVPGSANDDPLAKHMCEKVMVKYEHLSGVSNLKVTCGFNTRTVQFWQCVDSQLTDKKSVPAAHKQCENTY